MHTFPVDHFVRVVGSGVNRQGVSPVELRAAPDPLVG